MMLLFIKLLLILLGSGVIAQSFLIKSKKSSGAVLMYRIGSIILGLLIMAATFSVYFIPEKSSGLVTTKIGKALKSGHLIARTSEGERGLQSEVLQPGYDFNLLYPWFMSIDIQPDFEVKSGQFAIVTARDGALNSKIVAEKWSKDVDINKMLLNFEYFVANGGQRGIQQYKLTTGIYRLNRHQWKNIEVNNLIEIEANEVLVIESKFGKAPAFKETSDDEILSVPLVESTDYRGIVNNAYPSGYYAIHPRTEKAHPVSIVLQTFIYGGGYVSNNIDLGIDPVNDKLITSKSTITPPEQANGSAFEAKTKDNYTVKYDVRVLGQIEPVQAPRFIGTIRDPSALDDKVIEPFTRNILSNITLKYTALELKDQKEAIGEIVSEKLRERTINTGFRTKTVEITNIDIPPIVLIPGKIASASEALKQALVQKEASVRQAIKVRNMQEQADNQEDLAQATVANAAADQKASSIEKLAIANKNKSNSESDAEAYKIKQQTAANKDRILENAAAYGELAKVLGKDNATAILLQETINKDAEKFKVPEVVVFGGNGGEGGNSIVNAHMLSKSIRDSVQNQAKVKSFEKQKQIAQNNDFKPNESKNDVEQATPISYSKLELSKHKYATIMLKGVKTKLAIIKLNPRKFKGSVVGKEQLIYNVPYEYVLELSNS